MTNKIGKYFCVAPWTHTYLSPQSERRICCASREPAAWQRQYIDSKGTDCDTYSPKTLEEHWNSEHMKSVRKRILAGEKIPECQVCNDQLLNLHTYRQYFTDSLFPHKIEDIINSTDETGYTTMNPISFDYRIYNLCNFKCRMCGEQLSSSWESEKRQMNNWSSIHDKWMILENKQLIQEFQQGVAEQELWKSVKNHTIEEIYWVGGEPLMYNIHWDVMNYLVKSGHSKNVVVRYNTNLSRTSYKDNNLYDLLTHFKRVNICASIDATKEIGEWIRTGLNWNEWLDNFKSGIFLNEKYGMDAMVLDVTLTLPGLLGIKDMIDLAVELNVKSYVKITFDFDSSAIMSPMCLPKEILNEICNDLIEYETQHGNLLTRIYSQTFRDMLNRPTFEDKYPDYRQGLIKGKERYKNIAEFRKDGQIAVTIEDIFKKNNKIFNWWNSI
jgi:organic radical activating enzyme